VLEWQDEGDRVVVRRAARYSSEDIHRAVFTRPPEPQTSIPALGFSDCLILEIARKAGHVPLGTFDKRLSKLNGVERL
jgi:predicted nucleic acid-binding protein